MKKFVSTMSKGFRMTFENGLTVSVQWGMGDYCENYYPNDLDFLYSEDARSDTAEVAVMHGRRLLNANSFLNEEDRNWCDDVVGYLTPEQVVDLLMKVKEYPADRINELVYRRYTGF